MFLASLTVTAYGVVHSDVLANLWPRTLAEQIAMLAVGAALTAGICMQHRRPAVLLHGWRGLFGAAGIWIVACFGAAPTLAAAAVLACCVIYGEVLLAAAGTEVEDPVTVAAIGIGATILVLVGAGIAQVPMLPVFWLLVGATPGCLLSARCRGRLARRLLSASPSALSRRSVVEAACAAILLFDVLYLTANAAMPERYYDALAMHFLIPSQVATFGHWTYDPTLAFAFFPIGADYLFSFAMALGGEPAAKLLNLAILLLTAALLHDIVREEHGARHASLAVILFLGIPMTSIVTASLFVENTLPLPTACCCCSAERAVLRSSGWRSCCRPWRR